MHQTTVNFKDCQLRKSNIYFGRLFFLCVPVALAAPTVEAGITITNTYVQTAVREGDGFQHDVYFEGTTIPTDTIQNVVDGGNENTTTIKWSEQAGETTLSFGFDQKRTGTQSSVSGTSATVIFVANANGPFELSGFYNATDVGVNESGYVYLRGELTNSDGTTLASSFQNSFNTHNEQFVLGGLGGDIFNYAQGLTGNLVAGETYMLQVGSETSSPGPGDSGASGLGNVTLRIGAAAVPEPTTAIAWGMIILGAVVVARCRSKLSV